MDCGSAWCPVCTAKVCGLRANVGDGLCGHCRVRIETGRDAIKLERDAIQTIHPDAFRAVTEQWMPPLEMDVRLYDMHKSIVEALRWTPPIAPHETLEVIMTYIYMDGTDGARKVDGPQGFAASAFCIVHELVSGVVRFGGFSGTIVDLEEGGKWYVGATKASNGTAEVQASIMASLWVLQSQFRAVTLCYDAQYAETIA